MKRHWDFGDENL